MSELKRNNEWDWHQEYLKRDQRIRELEEFIRSMGNKNQALKEELFYWVTQKGCECGHPACSNCKDTKEAKELLDV